MQTECLSDPPVLLEPDSLYISTEFLISPGFHWAMLLTDKTGHTTRHEWAEDLSRETAEKYQHRPVHEVATYTPEGRLVFAYFKIRGYNAAEATRIAFDWIQELQCVFPEAYPTWIENRKHKLSCRTWIIRALDLLKARGILHRPETEKTIDVEEAVKRRSGELEVELGAIEEAEQYHARVEEL